MKAENMIIIGGLGAALSLVSLSGCDNMVRRAQTINQAKGANAETMLEEERPYKRAEAFDVRSSLTVEFYKSDEPRLIITGGNREQIENVVTEERGGTLYIYSQAQRLNWGNRQDLCIKIYTPNIKRINLSGATDAVLRETFHLSNLDVVLSGASDFEARHLDLRGVFSLTASGSSDTYLAGRVQELRLHVSGSSDVNASHLAPVKRARVVASGSSDVELGVVEDLAYDLSGASDLEYSGRPRVSLARSSGSSSVNVR